MTLTQHTAKQAARSVCKSTGFIRRSLDQASKSEQDGTQGAREERISITAKFTHDRHRAKSAVDDTEAVATSYERAIHILATRSIPKGNHSGVIAQAVRMVRFNASDDQLHAAADRLRMGADAARLSAEKAQARLDDADADLICTEKLGEYLHVLAKYGFQRDHPAVRKAQKTYTAWKAIKR